MSYRKSLLCPMSRGRHLHCVAACDRDYSGGTMHTDILAYKCQPVTDDSISNQFWWFESV